MSGPAGPEWGPDDAGVDLVTDATWELLGTSFRIACTSAAIGGAVGELLASFPAVSAPAPPERRFLVIDGCERHGGGRCVHTGRTAVQGPDGPGPLLAWLLATVNAAAIDGFDGFAVHAGVLAHAGLAVAAPAPSGRGKTTLVAAGLVAGFDYVSDEALCVTFGTRQLVPYPRALALSSWSRTAVGLDGTDAIALDADEVGISAGRLGAPVGVPPLALAHVVRLVHRPGQALLVRADRAEAMTWLLKGSFNHYKRPAESFQLAAELTRRAGAWTLEYGHPTEAAALLLDRLS